MLKSKTDDVGSKVVIIGGKKLTVSDVRKSFAELEFSTTIGSRKVMDVLINTKEPLTREQISEKAKMSSGYAVQVLLKLEEFDYAVQFHIGKRKTIYYAITEQGYNALANKEGKTPSVSSPFK
jgi:DNA-binding transcriptional regulator GbsR (MarR family)